MNKQTAVLFLSGLWIAVLLTACKKHSTAPYFPSVRQIVQTNCLSCHSANGQGRPVVLDTDQKIVDYGESIRRTTTEPVSPTNHRMPQGGELSNADKTIIRDWINAGGQASN